MGSNWDSCVLQREEIRGNKVAIFELKKELKMQNIFELAKGPMNPYL